MRALVSVSDKTGLVPFVKGLAAAGYEIVSTGGTKRALDEAGIQTTGIEQVTGFPEILGGRVKTLHPLVHGGILARRDREDDMATLKEKGITPVDLVCVNLYPFKQTIEQDGVALADAVEQIDIGGPSMIRAAAKNYRDVTVVVDQADYVRVLEAIKNGGTDLALRGDLAAKAFRHTASYDAVIAGYLTKQLGQTPAKTLTLTYDKQEDLRYGENSHQQATLYKEALPTTSFSLLAAKQLHGKQLSYNNIKDADAAMRAIREFSAPTVVAMKHMNPCGIGTADKLETAWDRAYEADSVSIFGGVIALNRPVDRATAEKMHQIFLEIIIAPAFDDDALAILEKKKNLRLLQVDFSEPTKPAKEEVSVMGGLLVQDEDVLEEKASDWQVATEAKPSAAQLEALMFAWKAVKHVKSNAIVVANGERTLGVGAGQPNRIDSLKIAVKHAGEASQGAVMASDAFFPFDDCVKYAAEHGITAIVQPGGSIRDQESIDAANAAGIAMVFTGVRHFRH